MKEVNINHIDIDMDGDGIPEKYILKDKTLNALFQTLANIAFSSDYNDLINQPTSLPASDVYEWAKNIAKPEYTKNSKYFYVHFIRIKSCKIKGLRGFL